MFILPGEREEEMFILLANTWRLRIKIMCIYTVSVPTNVLFSNVTMVA